MKKVLKIAGIVLGITVGSAIALVLLALIALNIAKFVIYSDYYAIESEICKNPGLGDGFVCQGIAHIDGEEKILVSGYMKDKTNSRVYVTDLDSKSYYVELTKNGEKFTGHAGGITVHGENVYIASGKRVYALEVKAFTDARNGDVIDIGEGIKVNNSASFIYSDDNFLYVGEFHDGGAYITDHPYETAEGTHYAIVSRYKFDDLETPDRIYSIRNKVQGICFSPDGKVIMSTSYGLTDSVYYVYNESDAIDSGLTLDGAPVYLLDKCIKEIKGPAMAEGLDYYNGKVITLTESASNKYIFGKFFFAFDIVGLEI